MTTAHLSQILLIAAAFTAAGFFAHRWYVTRRALAIAQEQATRMAAELAGVTHARNVLRAGCQFYACDTTWRPNRSKRHSIAYRDRGEVARVALGGGSVEPVVERLHAEARAAEAAAQAAVDAEQQKIKDALATVETPA